jgi:hypothetical protein
LNGGLTCKINDIEGENRILKQRLINDEDKLNELQSDLNKSQMRESILVDQTNAL